MSGGGRICDCKSTPLSKFITVLNDDFKAHLAHASMDTGFFLFPVCQLYALLRHMGRGWDQQMIGNRQLLPHEIFDDSDPGFFIPSSSNAFTVFLIPFYPPHLHEMIVYFPFFGFLLFQLFCSNCLFCMFFDES